MEMDEDNAPPTFKWTKPEEVMKLHQLKKRKNALQARIKLNKSKSEVSIDTFTSEKRKNPFAVDSSDCKRSKNENLEDSDTIFKLLCCTSSSSGNTGVNKENRTDFSNILNGYEAETPEPKEVVKGETFIPIDWTLKTKVRFFASKQFPWSQKVRISEEASAITGFVRCLDTKTTTTSLDTSPNAKFHQCCLFWQQPCLPWLTLFPRTTNKANSIPSIATNTTIKEGLHQAYTDGLKSLFQLLRTRQCPYFYVCANNFTALFRAAGICGFGEMNAMVTPTTRGFRQVLRQEDVEFRMPLKKNRISDQEETVDAPVNDDEDEVEEEEWLKQMGIGKDDIKKINLTQEKIRHKIESEIDNGAESLVFIEGIEVPAFYNFLMNCKSVVPLVGALAGIPPTLLSPVAFNGGAINSLKIREKKVNVDNETFFSVELQGPILPHLIHNLHHFCQPELSVTASFTDLKSTQPFSKVRFKQEEVEKEENVMTRSGSAIFKRENLVDCGFPKGVLESFCSEDPSHTINYDNLKYCGDTKLYNWI